MTRENLYKLYIEELKAFNPDLRMLSAEETLKNYEEVSNFSDLTWIDIWSGVERVGFLLATTGMHCPMEADYHIMECFVAPGFRRKGLMKKTVMALFKSDPGDVAIFILNSNYPALELWRKIILTGEFKKTYLPQYNSDYGKMFVIQTGGAA